jgi:hypothetical protein
MHLFPIFTEFALHALLHYPLPKFAKRALITFSAVSKGNRFTLHAVSANYMQCRSCFAIPIGRTEFKIKKWKSGTIYTP